MQPTRICGHVPAPGTCSNTRHPCARAQAAAFPDLLAHQDPGRGEIRRPTSFGDAPHHIVLKLMGPPCHRPRKPISQEQGRIKLGSWPPGPEIAQQHAGEALEIRMASALGRPRLGQDAVEFVPLTE